MTDDMRTSKSRALLTATVAVLQEKGYGGLTTAEVAKRAGVSTATLYRRWRSKEDLVIGTSQEWSYDLGPAEATGSLAGDLRALLRDKMATLNGPGGHLLRALIGEAAHSPALSQALNTAYVQPIAARIETVLGWAVERGEIPPLTNPRVVTDLVLGATTSAAFFTRAEGDAAEELLPFLLRALGAQTL